MLQEQTFLRMRSETILSSPKRLLHIIGVQLLSYVCSYFLTSILPLSNWVNRGSFSFSLRHAPDHLGDFSECHATAPSVSSSFCVDHVDWQESV